VFWNIFRNESLAITHAIPIAIPIAIPLAIAIAIDIKTSKGFEPIKQQIRCTSIVIPIIHCVMEHFQK